jgi:CubicO group peptidase (beta-lactamase class C family)
MHDTHCNLEQYINSSNRSQGYQNKKEVDIMLSESLYDVSGMGNMFSTVRDLERWSQFLLNGNDSILSKELIDYNLSSHINIGFEEPFDGFSSMSYGFGWYIFDYFGHNVVLHHGDNVGHRSLIVLMPDDDLSFVIIANDGMHPYGFTFSMAYSLMDLFIGRKANDWCSLLPMDFNFHEDSVVKDPIPLSKSIQDYEGEFYHEGFGTIDIYFSKGKLMLKAGGYTDELTHKSSNTFKAYFEEFQSEAIIDFLLNDKNEIISIQTDLIEPSVEMIEFKKRL